MKYQHILVTGGAGFIGSYLVDKLIDSKYRVTIYDNLEDQVHGGKKPAYLNQTAKFIKADVRDYASFKRALKGIDVVFHLASAVGVGQSNYQIKKYTDVTIGGTANLLDIIVNSDSRSVKRIIVTSSMTAYGEGRYVCSTHRDVEPDLRSFSQMKTKNWQVYCPDCTKKVKPKATPETASQPGSSIYALSKKTQEDMLMLIGKMYNIPTVALRCFNVYGPRQSLSNPYTGVTAIFISRLKNDKPPIVYEDGQQTRDFVSVHDVVGALTAAMKSPAANYQDINIGSGKATSIKQVAETLAKVMGVDIQPAISGKPRKNDIRHCYADITKAKKILKWKPKINLESGLKELVQWSEKQEAKDDFAKANRKLEEKGII